MRKLNMLAAAATLCLTANLAFLPGIASAAKVGSHKCESRIYPIASTSGSILPPMTLEPVASINVPDNCAYSINVQVTLTNTASATVMCEATLNGMPFYTSPVLALAAGVPSFITIDTTLPKSQDDRLNHPIAIQCASNIANTSATASGNATSGLESNAN
jgi:hypothetical protein